MLTNYLRYALYTLRRHPTYAGLNILGLSLALGCCLLLYWYVSFHLSVDRYHANADRVVRLMTEVRFGRTTYSPGIPTPVGPALRRDLPWLDKVAMSIGQTDRQIRVVDEAGRPETRPKLLENMAFVEPDYFSILDYGWVVGSPQVSLQKPFTAVLTRSLAKTYFSNANPIGRCLLVNSLEIRITGLLDDIPVNTDQPYELFVSYATLNRYAHIGTGINQWDGVNFNTYCWVLLPHARDTTRLTRELPAFHQRNSPSTAQKLIYHVVPLTEQHFASTYNAPIDYETPWVLSTIGVLLLLTGCINFINMATAQAFRRGREIGVRRVIGATRWRVFWQFMVETAVITALAAGLGIVLAYTALPFLRQWSDTAVPFGMDAQGWLFLGGLIALVTVLAGTYPGLMLAGFRPALVLKGQTNNPSVAGLSLRQGLVVGQLVLSQVFIVVVIVMVEQLTLWLRADPGFATQNRVVIPVRNLMNADLNRFRAALMQIPGVEGVSFSFAPPVGGDINTNYVRYHNRPKNEPFQIVSHPADAHYLPLFEMPLVAGRNLSDSDTVRAFVINETAVRMLGETSPQAVLGRTLIITNDPPETGPIVGVVRDWRHNGFKNNILPMALMTDRRSYSTCLLRLSPGQDDKTLKQVRTVWNRFFPTAIYSTTPVQDLNEHFYTGERHQLRIIQLAAGVAILIGCVGLYGLIAFLINRRTREIAVRKALGAREEQVVWLFVREFVYLLLIAFIIAVPIAGWLMRQWLDRYTTRIEPSPGLFLIGLTIVALVTLLTIGYQTLRAALANPARALRAE